MVEVGRVLWRSCCPTLLLKQADPEQVSQDRAEIAFQYLPARTLHSCLAVQFCLLFQGVVFVQSCCGTSLAMGRRGTGVRLLGQMKFECGGTGGEGRVWRGWGMGEEAEPGLSWQQEQQALRTLGLAVGGWAWRLPPWCLSGPCCSVSARARELNAQSPT